MEAIRKNEMEMLEMKSTVTETTGSPEDSTELRKDLPCGVDFGE